MRDRETCAIGVIGVFAGMVWPILVPIVGLGLLARALSKEDP
jgi:hypothetical protein